MTDMQASGERSDDSPETALQRRRANELWDKCLEQDARIAVLEADRDRLQQQVAQLEVALMGADNGVRAAERRAEEAESLLREAVDALVIVNYDDPADDSGLCWCSRQWAESFKVHGPICLMVREVYAQCNAHLAALTAAANKGEGSEPS